MGDEDQIRGLLETYERSLNTSDAALAAACYMSDGVFMPTTLPTTTGPAMHEAYVRIFDAIQLSVTFTIDELVVASDQVAYALTRSNGTQTTRPAPRASSPTERCSSSAAKTGPGRSAATCSTSPNDDRLGPGIPTRHGLCGRDNSHIACES
jgi:ketosteroid isomerase-like protein